MTLPYATFAANLDATLRSVIAEATVAPCPPRLAAALHYAVFPGGKHLRGILCQAVAHVLGDDAPALTLAAAAAIELLQAASLVHDDMPAFDNAQMRRGKPAVHRQFGEATALLVGDALIVLATNVVANAKDAPQDRVVRLISRMTSAVGCCISGQAWEAEPEIDLDLYHQTKTAVGFEVAAEAGALCAGQSIAPWTLVGRHLGIAYQVLDDIQDTRAGAALGKDTLRDEALGRPNAVVRLGRARAEDRLRQHLAQAVASIPESDGSRALAGFIENALGGAT